MIIETWEQILKGRDVRQNLSSLRKELKENHSQEAVLYHMAGGEQHLVELLQNEDAKIRKNTALLMGDLGKKEFLKPLYEAYAAETQRFVRSSYLSAMKAFDCTDYLEAFQERLEELSRETVTPENGKHLTEEMRELSALIVAIEGVQLHKFTKVLGHYEVILLTNRNFPELTLRELQELEPGAKAKIFGAGVMAEVDNLEWISGIRTYTELLFVQKGMKTCPMDPEQAAKVVADSGLLKFLSDTHEGKAPYYFRVEFKSRRELDKRSAFTRKFASRLEQLTDRALINTTSDYEFEIRLIENKAGTCNILLKLYTLPDERFSYRREVTPTSIRPTNAALTVALAKEYLKEGAQVLDPFCGVGTMLIERYKAVPAKTTYGIDIQRAAVEKARENTEAAHQIIHYINRDFFDFKHEYLFDEVICDMPFAIGRKTEEEITELYVRFFSVIRGYLSPGAILVLYTHNRTEVRTLSGKNQMKILKEFEISKKEGTNVFVLQCP